METVMLNVQIQFDMDSPNAEKIMEYLARINNELFNANTEGDLQFMVTSIDDDDIQILEELEDIGYNNDDDDDDDIECPECGSSDVVYEIDGDTNLTEQYRCKVCNHTMPL